MVSCLLAPGSGVHASPACVSGAATVGAQDKASRHGKLEDCVWLQHVILFSMYRALSFGYPDLHKTFLAH